MAKVVLNAHDLQECVENKNPNMHLDTLLRRFKKQVEAQGILEDCKKHEFFLKKSLRRKEKSKKAKIRNIKLLKKMRTNNF